MRTWHWCAIVFALAMVAVDLAILASAILFPALWLA